MLLGDPIDSKEARSIQRGLCDPAAPPPHFHSSHARLSIGLRTTIIFLPLFLYLNSAHPSSWTDVWTVKPPDFPAAHFPPPGVMIRSSRHFGVDLIDDGE